ncbi:DNA-directed RNA polymerase subunit beta [Peribacillus sp. NPDC097675]|uniref:DNA-directed RNA polymerase subunit beta n=1 Tax=Peribacillus sp. NPDC097675 TaxID=3390618 RepID=UPI003D03D9B7
MEQKSVMRQEVSEEVKEVETTQPNQRIRVRLLPIWLRLLIIMGLIIVALVAGSLIGYSVIGGGQATDVFKKSTWTHIIDIVNEGA